MSEGTDQDWARQRSRAIAAHAAERDRREAAEAGQARELIAGFVRDARERGLPTRSLSAQGYDGRTRYRTGLRGWYLGADHTLAIGEDGEFYILTVPGSMRARLTGATVRPASPRLVIGEGARDGERISLRDLLRLRLERDDL
ncbi:hypothetical protein GCM10023322_83710 [Rugosimonospora acidiphila]|uniref:Uncharacterized protein n=1 Tax=Rugosimonospora acidiphila TaxID=556531 RepID=A0ABP9SSZ0_9ACTN